jgi:hypothetical protein
MIILKLSTLSGFHSNVEITQLGFVKYNYEDTNFIGQLNRLREELV